MEIPVLLAALGLGFAARIVKLPPLVGYLVAGFVLHAFGVEASNAIDWIADLGVLLLLFGVGLKLRIGTLARPSVWGTTTAFTVGSTIVYGAALLGLGLLGLPLASDLDVGSAAIVGFALSFASTVFAVQALERSGETNSLAGRVAVGVLVLQDIFAVGFLVVSSEELPSAWAFVVVPALLLLRPVGGWILDRAGHGEFLVLFGITVAVAVGAGAFEAVGLKPDLGALIAGIVLSNHPRAGELAHTLMGYKDILLIGFFMSIGLAGFPPMEAWMIGAVLVVLIPLRSAALFVLFTRFRLRARTSLHASFTLSTYSEFGLIVGAAALSADLISQEWVSTAALAVAGSFIVGSWTSAQRYRFFERWSVRLSRLERDPIHRDDAMVDCGRAMAVIFGMGRIGTGAYDEIVAQDRGEVVGVDRDPEIVDAHVAAGREVVPGDALDFDFWERFRFHPEVELVVAAMSNHAANLECVRRIREYLPNAQIAAIATYSDQVDELRRAGVDVARNLYEEAGQALAFDAGTVVWGERDGA